MSDKLKLSDPKSNSELERIAQRVVVEDEEKRVAELERNIADLTDQLSRQQGTKASILGHANKIGARKSGTFKAVSTAPSINKTPRGPSMVPVAYITVQDLSTSIGVATNVRFNGDPIYLLDASTQPTCMGDERGTGGGVRSGTVNGPVRPVQGSQTVKAQGKHIVRHGDPCTMNGGNNPGVYVTFPPPSKGPTGGNGEQPTPDLNAAAAANQESGERWREFTKLPWQSGHTRENEFSFAQQLQMKASRKGPSLVAVRSNGQVTQRLKAKNSLEIALLGPFGGLGVATRLLGGSEEKVAASNMVGAASMGVLFSRGAVPGSPALRQTGRPSPSVSHGLRVVGKASISSPRVSEKVQVARNRQNQMLLDDVGYNISPLSWDAFPALGRLGTFVTDRGGLMKYFGNGSGRQLTVSAATARQIEAEMGLAPGSLKEGFKVRKITGIRSMEPSSPLAGNKHFQGPGAHLPGGAPEMVIRSVPPSESPNVQTIFTVRVGP